MSEQLVDYYHRRSPEYEAVWERDDPRRREEQRALAAALRTTLQGRRVLEVACGTGYWTERLAGWASSITAVDAAPGMLERARVRGLPGDRVTFLAGDAYRLSEVEGDFDGGLAAFWLSHVARSRLPAFLESFHRRLDAGAAVFLADNVYIPGLGGELVDPREGDTYKRRSLADGSEHLVLKNYYSARELRELLSPHARDLRVEVVSHFWWAGYRLAD